jgi:hypothetical protein
MRLAGRSHRPGRALHPEDLGHPPEGLLSIARAQHPDYRRK